MKKLRKILSYIRHYGIRSTFALAYEKLFLDKKRFSAGTAGGSRLPSGRFSGVESERRDSAADYSRKKVLYAIHYFYPERRGGTERFTLNVAKTHVKLGGDAVVLVLDANLPRSAYPHKVGGILYREYEYNGIRCIGFRHVRAPLGLYYKNVSVLDVEMRNFARFILEKEGIDIVHATYPQPFAAFLAECRVLGVPYVVTCTDFAMCCHYATMVDKRGSFCDGSLCGKKCAELCRSSLCSDFEKRYASARGVLEGAVSVTVPSEFVRSVFEREFAGIAFTVVNHGIGENFVPERERESVKTFLYAGTLSPLKGVHLLLDAFSRLPGDTALWIAGGGDEKYIRSLMRAADPRVRFLGAVDAEKMHKLYCDADCIVVPSMWYETYNFVLREAGACGAVTVAADIGAMPEAIDVEKNGFLFEVGSVESLHDALLKALNFDYSDYSRINYPTLEDEGRVYEEIYDSCTKNRAE